MCWKALEHYQALPHAHQHLGEHSYSTHSCSHGLLPKGNLPVIPSTCFLPSSPPASYLPVIIYPEASFLIRVSVSLEVFAFGKFSQTRPTDASVDSFTSTHNTLCYNFYHLIILQHTALGFCR